MKGVEEQEWQARYDPRKLKLGMVSRNDFVDYGDTKYFAFIRLRINQFEAHVGERLPEDLRKYLLYCGHLFYNWSCCSIDLSCWNEKDEKDERPHCVWCPQPLSETQCAATNVFDGTNLESGEQHGLIRFSHEGCGLFKYIVVKGPLKGTIWSGNPNGDGAYLSQDEQTFKELLDSIYKH